MEQSQCTSKWIGRIECLRTVSIEESDPLDTKAQALKWARAQKRLLDAQGIDTTGRYCSAYAEPVS